MAVGHERPLQLGQRWRSAVVGPEVRPDDAAALLASGRRSRVTLCLKSRLGRLVGHVDAGAVDVELPAVVDAAQPGFFVAPEEQRRAAMRAVVLRAGRPARWCRGRRPGPRRAGGRAPDRNRARQLRAQRERLPEPAQQVAHRRARSDSRQQLVVFLRKHVCVLFWAGRGCAPSILDFNGASRSVQQPTGLAPSHQFRITLIAIGNRRQLQRGSSVVASGSQVRVRSRANATKAAAALARTACSPQASTNE